MTLLKYSFLTVSCALFAVGAVDWAIMAFFGYMFWTDWAWEVIIPNSK